MTIIHEPVIWDIAPQFFSTDLTVTLKYYQEKLGFCIQFVYGDTPHYAAVNRDGHSIMFRFVDVPMPQSPEKLVEEYLDAYIRVRDIDALYAQYRTKDVSFARELGLMPWGVREFVVRDCDGRLLCFGQGNNESA